jgi:hypothetical protein
MGLGRRWSSGRKGRDPELIQGKALMVGGCKREDEAAFLVDEESRSYEFQFEFQRIVEVANLVVESDSNLA